MNKFVLAPDVKKHHRGHAYNNTGYNRNGQLTLVRIVGTNRNAFVIQ